MEDCPLCRRPGNPSPAQLALCKSDHTVVGLAPCHWARLFPGGRMPKEEEGKAEDEGLIKVDWMVGGGGGQDGSMKR